MSRVVESPTELSILLKERLRTKRGPKSTRYRHPQSIQEKTCMLKTYNLLLSEYATTSISIRDLAVSNGMLPAVLTHIIESAASLLD